MSKGQSARGAAARKRQVVVVTGASAGVGRAVASRFARTGAAVALLARDEDRLARAAAEVREAGGEALAIPLDVADAAAVERAAATTEATFGPIDVWINNAMVSVFSPFAEMTADEYRRVTDVTYHGCVYGTMAALKRMRPRDEGAIVQVGSTLAYRGIPLQSAYCGAKHAIQGFTESLRTELLHDGSRIRLSMVQLPAMNTPQFDWTRSRMPRRAQPVPPIYQPEVAAEGIYWAAHHDRRELHVGHTTTLAIAGNKVAPGIGDRYLARTGYDAQQTEELEAAGRPDNLFDPVPGDYGAHGRFDDRARRSSLQLWVTMHRGWAALAGAGVLGLGLLAERAARAARATR